MPASLSVAMSCHELANGLDHAIGSSVATRGTRRAEREQRPLERIVKGVIFRLNYYERKNYIFNVKSDIKVLN